MYVGAQLQTRFSVGPELAERDVYKLLSVEARCSVASSNGIGILPEIMYKTLKSFYVLLLTII